MRVGFIGLGAMGSHMARNLHRAGLLSGVWNRTPEKARSLAAELGVAAPDTPAALAAGFVIVSASAQTPPSPAGSVGLFVYPAKGQDAAQQSKDETEFFRISFGTRF